MSLTKQDLAAISAIVKEQISGVENHIDSLEGRFDTLEGRFDKLEGRFDKLEGRFDKLEDRVENLEKDMKIVRVDILENQVIPRLNTIEKCYVDTSKRYMESAEKFDSAIADISVMKLAIQKNSADIHELQLKQA